MALQGIRNLVSKYDKLTTPDKEVREALIALCERFAGVEIPMGSIKIIRGVAQMRVSPVVKNQILLNQEKILSNLALLTGKKIEKIL
ncbi:MAG: hypothetical protein WC764_02445 [Candidatus Paceibacterota bacterium]|jgi:hypothetical protein